MEQEPDTYIRLANVRVPLAIVEGRYEDLTLEELNDHINDVLAEFKRRLEHSQGLYE